MTTSRANDRARAQVFSVHPIVLPVPGRPVELELRVSAPATGDSLPILLLSHGHGPSNYLSSLYGYGPLANHYAAQGFVVIQPTHPDSKDAALPNLESSGRAALLALARRGHDTHPRPVRCHRALGPSTRRARGQDP